MKDFKGLSEIAAQKLLKANGENTIETNQKTRPLLIFANQFRDIMVLILLAATAISLILGDFFDSITIIAIVLMNAILGFIQEYRTEKGAGIYTEQGYRTEEPEKQTPVRYTEQEQATEQKTDASSGSGIYVTNKGLSGGALVAAILVAILTFPIWISILATAFGLLVGFFGAVIGIVAGFGVGGVVCIIVGVVAFAIGIVKTFTIPVVGAALIAAGLLVIGVGCLMIAAVGGIIRLAAWVVGGLIKLLNRLFHGRKGATA